MKENKNPFSYEKQNFHKTSLGFSICATPNQQGAVTASSVAVLLNQFKRIVQPKGHKIEMHLIYFLFMLLILL